MTPGDYFLQLLRLIQEALSPESATAWGIDERGVLTKVAEVASATRGNQPDSTAARARTNRILDALAGNGPRSSALNPGDGQSAVELLVPFTDGARACGVIEVVISQSTPSPHAGDQALAIVNEMAGYASNYVQSLRASSAAHGSSQFVDQLNRLALELHSDLCVNRVALTAVNEGRSLLGYDRVSLAARRGQRTEILAVSGQERIITRSNLVRAMTELSAALIEVGKPFRCDGDVEILPPQLRDAVLEYMKESGARSIEAFPLRQPGPAGADSAGVFPTESCGLLLGEFFQPSTAGVDPTQAEMVADHVATALTNARQWERNSTPFRRILRQFFGPAEFRNARQATVTLAVVAATLVAVGMTPVSYHVEAPGRLMPLRRGSLFAPLDGRVEEVLVDGNQKVAPGQLLLRMGNERLASEILTARHQLQEQQQLLATLEAQSAEAQDQGKGQDSIRLRGAISQAKIEMASLQSRLASLETESRDLEVRSPLAGTVTTFDPQRLLLHRPVRRGEALLEVMDADGRWELVLDLPAHRVGHVLRAQTAAAASAIPVHFVVAAQPENEFTGALRTVSSRIVAGEDGESVAPLEVNVAISDIEHPVAGADVIARIDCGKRALAWVLFGDFVDFFRRRLW
jgi:multidrug efflux pump subunit AcrA (membrane-fusion protein)